MVKDNKDRDVVDGAKIARAAATLAAGLIVQRDPDIRGVSKGRSEVELFDDKRNGGRG